MIKESQKSLLNVYDLGLMRYEEALRIQRACVSGVIDGGPPALLICEHPPILTLGRSTQAEHILLSPDELAQRNMTVLKTDRGGDVTLHAPGQMVVYPIMNLNIWGRDLRAYLHKLEEVAIAFLSEFAIVTSRSEGLTGVWCDGKKVASIGIGVRKWVAYHGLGINLKTDLALFSAIKPCGLDVEMTSVEALVKREVDFASAKKLLIAAFCATFCFQPQVRDKTEIIT